MLRKTVISLTALGQPLNVVRLFSQIHFSNFKTTLQPLLQYVKEYLTLLLHIVWML